MFVSTNVGIDALSVVLLPNWPKLLLPATNLEDDKKGTGVKVGYGVFVGLSDGVGLGVLLLEGLGEGVGELLTDGLGVGLAVVLAEGLGVGLSVGVGVAEPDGEGLGVGLAEPLGVGVGDADSLGVGVAEAELLGVGVADADSEGLGVGEPLMVGVGVGAGFNVREKYFSAFAPLLSITCTKNVKVNGTLIVSVGVPEYKPLEFKVKPVGAVPNSNQFTYTPVPPVARNWTL
jgi:hypothetical protein